MPSAPNRPTPPRVLAAALVLAVGATAGCGALLGVDFEKGHAADDAGLESGTVLDGAIADAGVDGAGPDVCTTCGDSQPPGEAGPSPEIVVFGGFVGTDLTPSSDTWTFDGTRWTQRTVTKHPSARSDHAMAGLNGKVVLFGGLGADGGALADTWIWDGAAWSAPATSPTPPPRSGHAMTTYNGRVVLYGGNTTNDTWTWDGAEWSNRSNVGDPNPPARSGHGMAAIGSSLLVFGGYSTKELDDTWLWIDPGWSPLTPTTPPGTRASTRMVTLGKTIVLFGGLSIDTPLDDTWTLDENATGWTQRKIAGPPYRWSHGMATLGNKAYVFGGSQGDTAVTLNDTWAFDGTAWKQVPVPTPLPPTRWSHAMAATQ